MMQSHSDRTVFSLTGHGPFERILRRFGLSDAGLGKLGLRATILVAIAWVPLVLLSLADGRAVGGVPIPLLWDVDLYIRCMLGLPLLLVAEQFVHRMLPSTFLRFVDRDLLPHSAVPRYEALLATATRRLESGRAELAILVLVYAIGVRIVWGDHAALVTETWYGPAQATAATLRPAGWWMVLVTVPLLQFLLLRWWYRVAIWFLLLLGIAQLPLRLLPLHPDRAGGIGFLDQATRFFCPLACAHGAMAAGWIANQIVHGGASLVDFKLELVAMTAIVVVLVMLPLLCFTPMLWTARRRGLKLYGALATRYAREFEGRWLGHTAPGTPLGSGDIQSLADLGNSYAYLRSMRVVPFGNGTATKLAGSLLLPILPLGLSLLSLDDIVARIVKLVF